MVEQQSNDTRFQPGRSGNPLGRPAGSRNKSFAVLDILCEDEAEAILRAMINKAKEGDTGAAKPILERAWPARKGARLSFDLPPINKAEELPAAIASITLQVAKGDISPDEAALIVGLLEAQRKAIETSELASRVEMLEKRLGKR